MKLAFIATALCTSAIITPAIAQTPAPAKEKAKRTANDIALETLNHVKSILATSATATDAKKAKQAVASINTITAKIVALKTTLEASPMPTVEEKKAFAQKMLQYETQVSTVISKMTQTFNTNSEDVNKIIQPAMTSFQAKTLPTMALLEKYYPKKEMTAYMKELKGK